MSSAMLQAYEQALAAAEAAAAQCSQAGDAQGHIRALMAQADLLAEQRCPQQPVEDMRPSLREALRVLQDAEAAATRLHAATTPPAPTKDGPQLRASTPAARLLSAVLLRMAQLELLLAREEEAHAASDQAQRRPNFPVVAGRCPDAVIRFLDQAVGKGVSARRQSV